MTRVGTDIIEVSRIARAIANWNSDFLQRVFTEAEIEKIDAANPDAQRAAGFWAAKESIVKALGCGFRNGVRFHDIEVTHDEYGCPGFIFSGVLKTMLEKQGINHISLSISHCRSYAIAVTLISS